MTKTANTPEMKWIKLTKYNIPDREVLAANFKPNSYGYKEKLIGYIGKITNFFYCSNDSEQLHDVTHFIDLTPFDILTPIKQ